MITRRHNGFSCGARRLPVGWLALLAAVVMQAGTALAQEQWRPTDVEMKMLPPYCAVRFNAPKTSVEYKRWLHALGPGFLHIHHYCAGLNFLLRSYRSRDTKDQRYNLNQARGNLTAVIGGVPPTFKLLPEMFQTRGITYAQLKMNNRAVEDLKKAIELDPHLSKSYLALADIYVSNNQKELGKATLADGLRNNPDTKSLMRRYAELGGDPAAIVPIPGPASAASSATVPANAGSSPIADGNGKP